MKVDQVKVEDWSWSGKCVYRVRQVARLLSVAVKVAHHEGSRLRNEVLYKVNDRCIKLEEPRCVFESQSQASMPLQYGEFRVTEMCITITDGKYTWRIQHLTTVLHSFYTQ